MATTESQSLLTAEQFLVLPNRGRMLELARGKVIEMTPPGLRHGQVCGNAYSILRDFVKQHDLGHVLGNDTGVVTERSPDSVRGADVCYYSFSRLPKGRLPAGYGAVPPDVVLEVHSPSDRRGEISTKVSEYLQAGVKVVCLLEPESDMIQGHRPDQPPLKLVATDEITLPEIAEAFREPVRRFFE